MPGPREWDTPGQEHQDKRLYDRYHKDVYLPEPVLDAAYEFLPHKGTPLPLSRHYRRIMAERKLPASIYMPHTYSVIEVTVIRAMAAQSMFGAIFRVVIRAPWNRRVDIVISLEGDYEVVTGFWASPSDAHRTLDTTAYVQRPPDDAERRVIDTVPEPWRTIQQELKDGIEHLARIHKDEYDGVRE